jgi:hypothetical protein
VMSIKNQLQRVLFPMAILSAFAGCGQQNTQRDNINAQDTADAQARYQDLAPTEGNYTGTVLLAQTHQNFAMSLNVRRIMQPAHSPQSQDPSESVSIPELIGNIRFPALDSLSLEDLPSFTALTDPMGGNLRANIQDGSYDGTTLVLPYSVNGATGIYGELSGQLVNGHFTGSWFSEEPSGTVGTFDLTIAPGSAS